MPPYRRETVQRYQFRGDRVRSAAAFCLLCAGLGYVPTALEAGPYGKLFLPQGSLHFNMSHSGPHVAAAFSPGAVGVDVETLPDAYEDIMPQVFTQAEICGVLASANPQRSFCALWTLKESYVKALGLGFSFPAKQVEFAMHGDEYRCTDPGFAFSRFSLADGELSVCTNTACTLETLELAGLCALWERAVQAVWL